MAPVHLRPIAATTWQELGRLVQSQLERRFAVESVHRLAPWGAAALQHAAHSLATVTNTHTHTIGIVTGFCVTAAEPPAAETDGPPGALMLADVLRALGMNVILISDRYGVPLLRAGAEHCRLADVEIAACPLGNGHRDDDARAWCESFLRDGPGRKLTHLVSIERAGPSHTLESIRQQTAANTKSADTNIADKADIIVRRFVEAVPAVDRDRCHNMRGDVIDAVTAPLHWLFESITAHQLPITTIGIGDGGNEIGLGALPWQLFSDLDAATSDAAAAGPANLLSRLACRVATEHTIVAGVSNWGGYALALAVAALCGLPAADVAGAVARQRDLVETLVTSAGAVDGFTGRCEPGVDGLDRDAHLAPLWQIRDLLFGAS